MNKNIKMHIISFGNNIGYQRLSLDILKKIKKRYPLSTYRLYTEKDLPSEILNFCHQHKRGFGYWIWKPIIIKHALKSMDDGNILFYVDGRTDFRSKSISWLENFYNNRDYQIAAYQMEQNLEYQWTNAKFFEHFGFENSVEIMKSGQFAATFSLFRKNPLSLKLINDWNELFLNNKDLFLDNYSGLKGYDFIENRHDQSAFSLLLKRAIMQKMNVYTINTKEMYSKNSLTLHGKSHPHGKFGLFVRYNKLFNFYYPIVIKLKNTFLKLSK